MNRKALSDFLDRRSPYRVCKREGHKWTGGMSMGPHPGDGGGAFIGLRYRIWCSHCGRTLYNTPSEEHPQEPVSKPGGFVL